MTCVARSCARNSRDIDVLAWSCTTVAMSRTSKLMAKPNSSICMSGTPTIIPKVTRSRDNWRISLTATARRRRNDARSLATIALLAARGHDEHVFEAGMRGFDARTDAVIRQQCTQRVAGSALATIREYAQADAELRDAVNPRQFADQARSLAAVGAFDL